MSAYRFCRTDDIALLVDALNRCWSPSFPDEPPMTPAAFKRLIRDLQVWCSSCMVAFEGSDPIGVLIGAKRPSGTLVHRIAVHTDHRRRGHGRHMLDSLGSKLAILGPPRISAEVAESLAPACELFRSSGYVQEARLTDYGLSGPGDFVPRTPLHARSRGPHAPRRSRGSLASTRSREESEAPMSGGYVIPVTVDDLAANGLLEEAHPQTCWERSVETLTARKDDVAGLAVVSDERIEAYVLYVKRGVGPEGNAEAGPRASAPTLGLGAQEARPAGAEWGDGAPASDGDGGAGGAKPPDVEIVSLRSFVEDGAARLAQLLSRLGPGTFRFPKVHPAEISKERLETLGFRAAGGHVLYATKARSEQA